MREEGDFEFFDEPTKFFLHGADFRDARRLRGKARDDLRVGRELRGAFGVLLRIQRSAFDARQQRFEITRQLRETFKGDLLKEAGWEQAVQFNRERMLGRGGLGR